MVVPETTQFTAPVGRRVRTPLANRPRELYAGLAIVMVLACVSMMRGASPETSLAATPAIRATTESTAPNVGAARPDGRSNADVARDEQAQDVKATPGKPGAM